MDYIEEVDQIIIRLDPGDPVLESLATVHDELDIVHGFLAGIGAVDTVTLGHYDVDKQAYKEEEFTG